METKKEIRNRVLALRDDMPEEMRRQYSDRIGEHMRLLDAYRSAEVILAYVSYRSEVMTKEMIRQALKEGKSVFVPKVCGDGMEFWKINALENLHAGYRGIPEPEESVSFPDYMNIKRCENQAAKYRIMMWMPGAVFDKDLNRIGYGKGFYDRYVGGFLVPYKEKTPGVELTVSGIAFSCQVLEQIPHEEHDIRPAILITESGYTGGNGGYNGIFKSVGTTG